VSRVIRLGAAIEFLDDLLDPEVYAHAVPSDAHARAVVVRDMLRKEMTKEMSLEFAAINGDSK